MYYQMMERVEPKAPLSVRPPALPVLFQPPAAPRAGSLLELPLGEIAGDFHAIPGGHGRNASYELLVANDTPLPVATFAYAAEQSNRRNSITWNAILVPPYSAIAVEIEVALPRRGRLPRVVAELHAEDAKLTLDGGPPHRFSRGIARRATLLFSALLLLLVGGVSVAKTQPRVMALAAPESVRGGAAFTVAYALGEASGADYTVETADGLEVGRGALRDRSGAFALSLPAKNVSTGYDVRVFAHGRFATDMRSVHIVALAASPPPNAANLRVTGLHLDNETVNGGDPIAVNYTTQATVGYVRLIDEIGTVRAEALLQPHGRSMLQAPYVDVDQDLRVVVDAQAGTARAEAEVPVRVLHADPSLAAAGGSPTIAVPALAPEPGDLAAAASAGTSGGSAGTSIPVPVQPAGGQALPADDGRGIISVAPVQRKGIPIVVRIDHYEAGLRVAVMGDSGDELEGVDAAASDTSIVLPALGGLQPSHLSVVATYAKGFGQETFIRPITLR